MNNPLHVFEDPFDNDCKKNEKLLIEDLKSYALQRCIISSLLVEEIEGRDVKRIQVIVIKKGLHFLR